MEAVLALGKPYMAGISIQFMRIAVLALIPMGGHACAWSSFI
jgi:hypothetical protein